MLEECKLNVLGQYFSDKNVHMNSREIFSNADPDSVDWGGAWDFVFLTSSLAMATLVGADGLSIDFILSSKVEITSLRFNGRAHLSRC